MEAREERSSARRRPTKGVGKFFGTILKVLVATVLLFVLLEGGFRLLGFEPVYSRHLAMLREAAPASATPRLAASPDYITNEDGLWVGNPAKPGVNGEGFRTPPFDEAPGERATVVFIGDSFVWGLSALPLQESFVDQVRDAGYRTVNLGIPGVGPVQYAAVAEKYLPAIEPDVVLLLFYPGNDFEAEPPVVPGQPRYYLMENVMLSAFDPAGNPWSLEEAHANYASIYGDGLGAAVQRTLLSSSLFSAALQRAVKASSHEVSLEVTTGLLERSRAAAEATGAHFEVIVIPVREEYRSGKNSNAYCAEVLGDFSPHLIDDMDGVYYAPLPDAHFNNLGHARMADVIIDRLTGLGYPPRPDDPTHVPVRAAPGPGESLSWEVFVGALSLSGEQIPVALAEVNGIKDDFAEVFSRRPSAFEASPIELLAAKIAAPEVGEAQAQEEFAAYARDAREPETGKNYFDAFFEKAELRYGRLLELLDESQRILLQESFLDRLLDVQTGHDPLGDRVAALVSLDGAEMGSRATAHIESMAFRDFAEALGLRDGQREAVRAVIDELKDAFVAVLSKPEARGGLSALESLAVWMGDDSLDAGTRNQQFDAYAREQAPTGATKSYFETFAAEAEPIYSQFAAILDEAQHSRLPDLPINSLLNVDTGHDPFGAALGAILSGRDPGEGKGWAALARRLELSEARREEIAGLIRALQAEHEAILKMPAASGAPAPFEQLAELQASGGLLPFLQTEQAADTGETYVQLLEATELATRRKIYGLLNRSQRAVFEEAVPGSLTELEIDAAP